MAGMVQRKYNNKIAAIIPCRLESERLYGKQMQLIGKNQILFHLIQNLPKNRENIDNSNIANIIKEFLIN